MNEVLPIGSIVTLKNGNRKMMIICRLPLYDNNGTVGYFDYGACVYPVGQTNQQTFFFNEEDIEEVKFMGFIDEDEERFLEIFEQKKDDISYPHLTLKDVGVNE